MSISTEPQPGTEIWTKGGPWRFTREIRDRQGCRWPSCTRLYHSAFSPSRSAPPRARC